MGEKGPRHSGLGVDLDTWSVVRPPAPQWVGKALCWADSMRPWSMMEVMLLGILVALIKIAELAKVEAGIGMYAVSVLMFLIPAVMASFDADAIWQRVRWADGEPPPLVAARSVPSDSLQ